MENIIIDKKRPGRKAGKKFVEYDSKQEMYKIYNSKYYEKHKDDNNIICDCGKSYKWYNKSHHLQSKKHIITINQV